MGLPRYAAFWWLGVLAAFVLPPEQYAEAHQRQAAANVQTAPQPTTVKPSPVNAGVALKPRSTLKYKPPCADPKDRDRCELEAEWESAKAARDAAKWAKWQTILSGLGIFGLLLTLHLSRLATNAALNAGKDAEASLAVAERNASALLSQVDVAKRASERHLRAYVGVSAIEVRPAGDGMYAAKLTVKNFGLTPAYNCRISTAARVDDFPMIDPHDNGPAPEGPSRDVTIYPSADIPAFAACNVSPKLQEIETGAAAVYVYGIITYHDAEGIERESSFAFRGTENTFFRNGEMHVCMGGNTAT